MGPKTCGAGYWGFEAFRVNGYLVFFDLRMQVFRVIDELI
jgi:hypothetical protein